MSKNQHVVSVNEKWGVKGEKNGKYTSIFNTQSEAINKARDIAINNKGELIIHGKNGRIREKNSYGNDNFPSKG